MQWYEPVGSFRPSYTARFSTQSLSWLNSKALLSPTCFINSNGVHSSSNEWIGLKMNMERFLQVITFITTFIKKNKKLYINMLDTGNSIGEILFLFKKKKKKKRPQHKENILLRVNKISMNCHYIKSSLLIGVFFSIIFNL